MKRHPYRASRSLFALAALAASSACSTDLSPTTSRLERVRSTQQPLTVASTNYTVSGLLFDRHEATAAYTEGRPDLAGASGGKWVVIWNNSTATGFDWSLSGDNYNSVWTTHTLGSPTAWGDPGDSPSYKSSELGGVAAPFAGWRGDPAIAPVTDPSINSNSHRVILAGLANSTPPGELKRTSDIAIAYSDDQGASWTGAQWITTGDDNGANPGMPMTGLGVDNPKLASNYVAPFDTFATWRSSNLAGDRFTWLRRISLNSAGVLSGDTPVAVPIDPNSYGDTPDIGFVRMPDGCSSGGEGVAVVYSNNMGRCANTGTREAVSESLYLAVWDVSAATWSGPWLVFADPALPTCVGASSSNTASFYQSTNNGMAHIAGDPQTSNFWISHTISTSSGTRATVEEATFACDGGEIVPTFNQIPTPCPRDPATGVCYVVDGVAPVQDEWLPSIGFATYGVKRTVMYWYGTRDDPSNTMARVYMRYREDNGAWTYPQQIYAAGTNGNASGWNESATLTTDYNQIGVDYNNGRFLAIWPGDRRRRAGQRGAFSTIQSVLMN